MPVRYSSKVPVFDVHERYKRELPDGGFGFFHIDGTSNGDVTFSALIPRGKKSKAQVNFWISAETILALADAIRCCPNHINEDPRTGAKGPQFPPMWIRHAFWHLENPERVRPCLDNAADVIDVDRALPPGDDVIDIETEE